MNIEANVFRSGSKIAIAGYGSWGKNLVRKFYDLGVLLAVCDSDISKREAVGAEYRGIKVVSDVQEILDDGEINAVVVATPAATHAELAKRSLAARKDVFVEKPLALSVEEGSELVEMARAADRVLMVGHILHYHPAVRALKDLVSSGSLGRIQYVYSHRLNFGKIRREENILWSFAPHDISVICALLGEEPAEVSARGANYLHPQIADVTVSQMRFESGANAHLFVSWLHPFKEQKLVVVGDRSMAVFDDTAPWESKLVLYPHEVMWKNGVPEAIRAEGNPVALEAEEPLRAECRHFVECVEMRKQPLTDGDEGLRGLRVLKSLQDSLAQGGSFVRSIDMRPDYYAHETAVVDEGASIGRGTKVWHFAHVVKGAEIGEGCTLGQNVVVMNGAKLGRNVKVQNNVSVFEKVTCEDDVFLGPSMIFTNINNPRSHISRRHAYKGTTVRRGATIGANATIICGNEIGEYAFVGAGSVVTRDVPPYSLVYGNPARVNGWVCGCGLKLPVGIDFSGETVCAECGSRYSIEGSRVEPVEKGRYASTSA